MAYSRRLRALITNDDGIDSPGLWTLARGAQEAGFDVTVAAPHIDSSGVGASVLSVREDGATRLYPRVIDALPGVPAFAVEGHPAFIVHAAGRGWLDPEPDVVLSGVNLGANVGRAVLHSGTVGAVLTAALHGWYGLAVSLDCGWVPPAHPHWDTVLHVLPEVLDVLLAGPAGTVLSVNVPDRPASELRELREARLAQFGQVWVRVNHRSTDGADTLTSDIEELSTPPEPGTDLALLTDGHPTVTELLTVADRPGVLDGVRGAARRRQAG